MSVKLEQEEVDVGYFIPVASTTLASIFKDDSTNDAAVNPSLKYKPPQPKKTEQNSKPDDPNASQCVFSCSIIAYEWVQGSHICKGKVGFAVMRIAKTGACKIILYSPDKSTLSCTTIVPQLEVTLKGAMISLYDDHKKYWGLYFNDKIIDQVKDVLIGENVLIKQYFKAEIENSNHDNKALEKFDSSSEIENSDSDKALEKFDSSSTAEGNASTLKYNKESTLNRIANVGHAVLPTLPGSPAKKATSVDLSSTPERYDYTNKLNVLPDVSQKSSPNNVPMQHQDLTFSQTGQNDTELNNATSNNIKQSVQTTATTVPLINNQIFAYVNGYMVPLHMQVPVLNNVDCSDSSADIELIIQKLTHLKGVIKTLEMKNNYLSHVKEETHHCTRRSHEMQDSNVMVNIDSNFKEISDMERLIKEKDDFIVKLENKLKMNQDMANTHEVNINKSNKRIEKLKQHLHMQNKELKEMIPKEEANMLLINTINNVMDNTFHSLVSCFDKEEIYTGNNVRGTISAVIKQMKNDAIDSLSDSFCDKQAQ